MSLNPELDLVLVNPASRDRVYQVLGQDLAAIEPPVWAGLMASFVRLKGFRVAILDAEAEGLSAAAAAQRVADMNPLLTAIVVFGHQPSASTQMMPAARDVCSALRQLAPAARTIMLGGHVAALPGRTLLEEDCDFVSCGEGLYTLVDLMEALKTSSPDLAKVRDLGYRADGQVVFTKPAPLVIDLDHEMPGVAWDLLPMRKYRAHNWHCLQDLRRLPYAAVYTTLGCPYKCSFCCIQAPFKTGESALGYKPTTNSYRFWSPEVVVNDLANLVEKYGITNVKFADEMFVLNRTHVERICDLIVERGLKLNIWAYARVDTVKDGTLKKLQQAGFSWLAMGIEAGNEKVRTDVAKGFDQDDIYTTMRKIAACGIHVIGNYIFGLPEDDHNTIRQTLDLASDLNCEFANFYSTMAYPGSRLYELARSKGWQLPESWAGYSQHSTETLPLPTNHLTAAEVLRFRDTAFQTYFTGRRYLDMVQRKFGEAAVAHIKQMTAVRLQRKYA